MLIRSFKRIFLFFCGLLLLSAVLVQAEQNQVVQLQERAKDQKPIEICYQVEGQSSTVQWGEQQFYFCNAPQGGIAQWHLIDQSTQTEISAYRTGNRIIIKGLKNGQPFYKEQVLNNNPWYFSLDLALEGFWESSLASQVFWVLNPDDFNFNELEAKRDGTGILGIDGTTQSINKVKVSPPGIASWFWSAELAFNQKTGEFLSYTANQDNQLISRVRR